MFSGIASTLLKLGGTLDPSSSLWAGLMWRTEPKPVVCSALVGEGEAWGRPLLLLLPCRESPAL